MANKGWSTNKRILELSEEYIQYYKTTKAAGNQIPKFQVQLQEIKLVGPTDGTDK